MASSLPRSSLLSGTTCLLPPGCRALHGHLHLLDSVLLPHRIWSGTWHVSWPRFLPIRHHQRGLLRWADAGWHFCLSRVPIQRRDLRMLQLGHLLILLACHHFVCWTDLAVSSVGRHQRHHHRFDDVDHHTVHLIQARYVRDPQPSLLRPCQWNLSNESQIGVCTGQSTFLVGFASLAGAPIMGALVNNHGYDGR